MSGSRIFSHRERGGFSLIELMVVIAIIAILAALLLPALARAKQKGQQAVCLSNLKQISLGFELYLNDHENRFADRRDLKSSLSGGYHPWTGWPPSDPRGGWAAIVLKEEGLNDNLWSCPASVSAPVGNVVQSLQLGSTNGTGAPVRYWLWRFDRPDDPVGLTDFWGKTEAQAVADLQMANDPTVGRINGPAEVELAVDPLFSKHDPNGVTRIERSHNSRRWPVPRVSRRSWAVQQGFTDAVLVSAKLQNVPAVQKR